jgi:hypothetical protein
LMLWNNFYVNKMSKIGLKDALFIKKIWINKRNTK